MLPDMPYQTRVGTKSFLRSPLQKEEVRDTFTVRTPESFHGARSSVLLHNADERTFRHSRLYGLIRLDPAAFFCQMINVPVCLLVLREMSAYPLVETIHRAAHITICPPFQIDHTQSSHFYPNVGEVEYQDIRSFTDHPHPFSSSLPAGPPTASLS